MVQQRLCLTCTSPFDVPATSKRRYCSVACTPVHRHSTKPRPDVELQCACCGKKFKRKAWLAEQQGRLGRAQYCSVDCRDTAKRGRKGTQIVPRVTKTCLHCGGTFGGDRAPNATRNQRYCSPSCASRARGGRKGSRQTRFLNGDGYVMVWVPKDERAPGREHRVHEAEHRLVMEKVLGRPLERREQVHHINGDRTDNRPENLQIRQAHHGAGQVLRCRSCGSHDLEAVPLE